MTWSLRTTIHGNIRCTQRKKQYPILTAENIEFVLKYGKRVRSEGAYRCQLTGRELLFNTSYSKRAADLLRIVVIISDDEQIITVYCEG